MFTRHATRNTPASIQTLAYTYFVSFRKIPFRPHVAKDVQMVVGEVTLHERATHNTTSTNIVQFICAHYVAAKDLDMEGVEPNHKLVKDQVWVRMSLVFESRSFTDFSRSRHHRLKWLTRNAAPLMSLTY